MKKRILLLISVLALMWGANAQKTGSAILKIHLHHVQSIVVHPSQEYVNLHYRTPEDYRDGVISKKYDHLQVFSTGKFVVKVNSDRNNLSNGTESFDTSTITISAELGTGNSLNVATFTEVSLSETSKNLISSGSSGKYDYFNVTYSGANAYNYADHLHGANPREYRTIVIYTIAPQ